MADIDPFASITGAILDLLMRDGDLFVSLGTNMFRGIAVILIAWFGIRAALASADGGSGLPLGRFVSLIMTIAFGLAMITYYRAPIPGIGLSFTQLLTDQPIYLARQLEITQVQRLSDRLNQVYLSLEQPLVLNVSALVGYFLVALAVTALVLREERWAQLVVLVFLVLVLLIGIFYYPTMFEPRQQTTFGWFENDVYLGLLTLALYLGIQRFRGVTLVPKPAR